MHARQLARVSGLFALLALLVGAGSAHALICGDADGNKSVTVTDGVAILRAAAALSDTCTLAVCDFDVSGAITVTDGVTALRKAAGLSIQKNCVPTRTFFDAGITEIVTDVQPFFDRVLPFAPQRGKPSQGDLIPCDNTFDDGVVEIVKDGGETTVTFSGCELGDVLIDGDLIDSSSGLEVAISFTFRNDDTLDFEGVLNKTDKGTSLIVGGFLEISAGLSFPEIGDFNVTINNLQVGASGAILGGQTFLDLRPGELEGFLDVTEVFDGSNLITTTITRDDQSTATALFDTITKRFL